ncbi:putative reverse transcriptase domain-containing protein [Tanacetum coccineum]
MVAAIEPKTIRKAVQIAGTLTDEALRNGSIKKNPEKRGNRGEPSKDRNVRDDNKMTRTGNAFTTTTNPFGRENTGTVPKCTTCSTYHPPEGRGNQGNQAKEREFMLGSEEARQDLNIVTGMFALNDHYATTLFDSGANYSFVTTAFIPLNKISFHSIPLRIIVYISKMPPKRTSTSAAPAMTQAIIWQLITDGIAAALEAQAALMANANNPNRNTRPREIPIAKRGNYKEFISCQPFYLNGFSYEIEIASGQLVEIDKVIKGCKLEIEGHVFDINLIPFGIRSFDVIIGMDWLSDHKAEIIYHEKVVRIQLLDSKVLRVLGENPEENIRQLMSAKAKEKKQEEIVVVKDFPEVFLDDLSRLLPVREIEFRIELVCEAMQVAKSPYRLAPSELEEFSGQLKEVQDKDFI